MPIDPRLSLMVQPLQIESPVNALAKVMSLKESQQGMQLNQMKVEEAKRAVENQNALRARFADPNLNLDDPRTQAEIYGLGGGGILKDRADAGRLSAQQKKTEIEAAKEKLGVLKLTAGSVMASPTLDNARAQLNRFGQLTGEDITDDMAQLEALGGDPEVIRRWAAGYALEADKLLPKFESRDLGGTVERVGYDPITGAPIGKPTVARKTMTPGESAQIAQRDRQFNITQANQAPTVTEVVDPNDPSKMIRVDARRYKGGGVGSPGVIGASGKEPTVAKAQLKAEEGKSQLKDVLENLRASYGRLDQAAAIPSTQRGAISNISSSVAATGVGQSLGRFVGAEAQKDRDVISSSRLQLLNAIKQATGMSAQQLNSNVELQTWLKAVTDPSQSIEAVDEILNNIENSYGNTTAPPVTALTGEDREALEWANNNPTDPRATAIKQRLGRQ